MNSTDNQNELILTKNIEMDFKPEATLKTNLCKIEEVIILTVEGRLDTANTNEFNTLIQPLLSVQNPNIIINCEGLLYISSSGLRSLITLQKIVKQHNGQLVLEAMRPFWRKHCCFGFVYCEHYGGGDFGDVVMESSGIARNYGRAA